MQSLQKENKRRILLQKKYASHLKLIKNFLSSNIKNHSRGIKKQSSNISFLYGDKQAKHYIGYTHLKLQKKSTLN